MKTGKHSAHKTTRRHMTYIVLEATLKPKQTLPVNILVEILRRGENVSGN